MEREIIPLRLYMQIGREDLKLFFHAPEDGKTIRAQREAKAGKGDFYLLDAATESICRTSRERDALLLAARPTSLARRTNEKGCLPIYRGHSGVFIRPQDYRRFMQGYYAANSATLNECAASNQYTMRFDQSNQVIQAYLARYKRWNGVRYGAGLTPTQWVLFDCYIEDQLYRTYTKALPKHQRRPGV